MTGNVVEALRLVNLLQAELVRVAERARLASIAAADAAAHSHALIEQLTVERDRLLERVENGDS